MDESLKLNISGERNEDNEQDASDGEDGGLDWTKLPLGSGSHATRPVIPKRGGKDFEPAHGGGSGLQHHNLCKARSAMFDALRSARAISSKSVSYAVWYPDLARAHVTVARGIHFTSMGHSVQRPSPAGKSRKRLELLPEETLYLMEKGALFCWKASRDDDDNDTDEPGPEEDSRDVEWDSASQGAPMSVQQAYAEMVGREHLTLDRYQAFSYLRRLGYIVTRAKPPSPAYPVPAAYPTPQQPPSPTASILRRVLAALCSPIRTFVRWLVRPSTTWWRPLVHRRWLHHNMDYPSIFKTLRFMPSGHSVPLQRRTSSPAGDDDDGPSQYEIFYHLYKPNTPYRKTAPPPPDFSVVVVNARMTPMPTLAEMTHLYGGLPVIPPPIPRRRHPPSEKTGTVPKPSLPKRRDTAPHSSFLSKWSSYFFPSHSTQPTSEATSVKVNPFMALRQGNKSVVIAVVDAGTMSFFKFGQGAFEEWPMV